MTTTLLPTMDIGAFKQNLDAHVRETDDQERERINMIFKQRGVSSQDLYVVSHTLAQSATQIIASFECQLFNETDSGETLPEIKYYLLDAATLTQQWKQFYWQELCVRKEHIAHLPVMALYQKTADEIDAALRAFQNTLQIMNNCIVASRNAQLDLMNLYRKEAPLLLERG